MANPPVEWIAAHTGMPAPDVRSALLARAQSLSTMLVGWGGSLVGDLTASVGNALLSLFVVFFLFQQGRQIEAGIYRWLPLERARTEELLRSVSESIAANVYGIAAVGIVQGVLTGLGFLFTGLPSPVLWAAVAALCSLLPLVGTALVWVPAALILLAQGAWIKALFLVFWGTFVVGMSDNFVRPWALSGRTEMNTLVVFFAVMGGMQVLGFIGLFAGPVIFSVAIALARMLREALIPDTLRP
jgi:predicted PurR-regulated permease PerM